VESAKNIARAKSPTRRRRTHFRWTTNNPEKSSAPVLEIVKRLTKIVKEPEHPVVSQFEI